MSGFQKYFCSSMRRLWLASSSDHSLARSATTAARPDAFSRRSWALRAVCSACRRACRDVVVEVFAIPGGYPLQIHHTQAGQAVGQCLRDHPAMAGGGVGLEAQQGGARPADELGRQRVELRPCRGLDVHPEPRRALGRAAGLEQPADVGRRAQRAPVLVAIPCASSISPSRVLDMPGRRDCGR